MDQSPAWWGSKMYPKYGVPNAMLKTKLIKSVITS